MLFAVARNVLHCFERIAFVASATTVAASAFAFAACEKSPPEIIGKDPTPGGASVPVAPQTESPASAVTGPGNLQAALLGLPATGPIYADLQTDAGKLSCRLFEDKAPITVANFVGLARGTQSFQDPVTRKWVKRPAYDGTTFHRIIKGFMIQGGDPKGMGDGEPGYVVPDEIWPGSKHDRAGLLCMANRGPNTNGMQFFITDAAAPHLDGNYTIFGECSPLEIVHKLGATPVSGERPVNKPTIIKASIRRG